MALGDFKKIFVFRPNVKLFLAHKVTTKLAGFESDSTSSCQHSPLLPIQETKQFCKEGIKMNKLFPWWDATLLSGLHGQSETDSWYKAAKDKNDFLIAQASDMNDRVQQ